ncbi:putative regulatory protein, FmdB family [Ectothiorhodosinus mongolicus]|uniref:Putative regulatory protein, FmdB family n=1 Tax=Ectothiorhodosinus mongolicus TaxID=233100 RepID=A0A1R3VPL4_9GAMM|nr:zinc ribbon domain-containing protein [Ectothiorhodosinus mongolicus]ULX56645.1 zinc ribbon domain-containing protein [Ectothiorhodosinus mongolicus]SIT66637.1 putative regulatory protein, FmdB family [Ectothiorhodosinus mongolicus]
MPIYEYECTECGHRHEAIQKMSDAALTECPACGASALRKLVSAAAFRLSGGGWYETDFKKDNKRNLKEADKGSAEGAKKAEGGKTADPAKKASSESASKPAASSTASSSSAASSS